MKHHDQLLHPAGRLPAGPVSGFVLIVSAFLKNGRRIELATSQPFVMDNPSAPSAACKEMLDRLRTQARCAGMMEHAPLRGEH